MTPNNGKRYQGVVPIESATLAECLQDYFLRSEQLPTRFVLHADKDFAVGVSLHAMPEQDSEIVAIVKDDWQRLNLLLDTVHQQELAELDASMLLTRLFHEEHCRLHEEKQVRFSCDCSRQRSIVAILSLGKDEITDLISEQEVVVIDCHFCFQRYEFSCQELADMLIEMSEE